MNKLITLISMIMIFLTPFVAALDWCMMEVSPETQCMETTPVLASCGSYTVDVYNPSNTLLVTNTTDVLLPNTAYNYLGCNTTLGSFNHTRITVDLSGLGGGSAVPEGFAVSSNCDASIDDSNILIVEVT